MWNQNSLFNPLFDKCTRKNDFSAAAKSTETFQYRCKSVKCAVPANLFFSCKSPMKRDALSYLWRICWAVDRRGTTVDRRDWRSRVVWGTRLLALLWKPCPAGRWWPPVVVAFSRARRTRSSLYPAATSPRPGSSPCATPRCCNANMRTVTHTAKQARLFESQ